MSEDLTPEEAARRAEYEERARKLFSGPVTFLLSAPQLKELAARDAEEKKRKAEEAKAKA